MIHSDKPSKEFYVQSLNLSCIFFFHSQIICIRYSKQELHIFVSSVELTEINNEDTNEKKMNLFLLHRKAN